MSPKYRSITYDISYVICTLLSYNWFNFTIANCGTIKIIETKLRAPGNRTLSYLNNYFFNSACAAANLATGTL